MRSGGTCSRSCNIRAAQIETNGNLSCACIHHQSWNSEWTDLPVSTSNQTFHSSFDRSNSTDARTDRNTMSIWIAGLKIKSRILCSFGCRRKREKREAIKATLLSRIQNRVGIEPSDFAGESNTPIFIRIEKCDRVNARSAVDHRVPSLGNRIPSRGESTHASNHNSSQRNCPQGLQSTYGISLRTSQHRPLGQRRSSP